MASHTERYDGTDDVQSMRAAVLPLTRGKTCRVIGGVPHEHQRARLQEVLGFREVAWREYRRRAPAANYTADVSGVDVVCILIRWVDHSAMQAREVAAKQGKPVVLVPKGLGASKLLADFYSQLVLKGR